MARPKPENLQEKIQLVLSDMKEKGMSVKQACSDREIKEGTFFDNVDSEQYARAREGRADFYFENMFELDRQVKSGEIDPQTYRALMDALKWRLGKMASKYSDKQQIDLTSSDRSMSPVQGDLSHLSYDQIYALAKKMNGQHNDGK